MGSRSKSLHRGEAPVPSALLTLLHIAAAAKAPKHDEAETAREVAKKLRGLCQTQYVSVKRLREDHKWTAEQVREPWAVHIGRDVLVVPKGMRRASRARLEAVAVSVRDVAPADDDDLSDASSEWVVLGNSGRGAPIWRWPSWQRVTFSPEAAKWLRDGLEVAIAKGKDDGPRIVANHENNILLAAAYGLCDFWQNPDLTRARPSGVFDAHGNLANEAGQATTLAEELAADKAAWEDVLSVDAEADAAAPAKSPAGAPAGKADREV